MNSLARLGFILVGTFVALESLSSFGYSLNFASASGNPINAVSFSALMGFSLVLGILPAVFIILRSRWLADYAVPQAEHPSPPESAELVTAALAVLGVILIVEGIPSAISSALTASASMADSSTSFFTSYAAQSAASIIRALVGLYFLRNAGRVSSWIGARRSSKSATDKSAT